MKRKILIIVNDVADLEQVQILSTKEELSVVQDVESAIEQLYRMDFDGILYEAGLEESQEKKLLKILSLQEEPPVIVRKESWSNWESSLDELIKSIPLKIRFIDDGFKNAGLNICLN